MKLAIVTDTNQPVASRTFPDAAEPLIREFVGGSTRQETAANFLAYVFTLLGDILGRQKADQERNAATVEGEAAAAVAEQQVRNMFA